MSYFISHHPCPKCGSSDAFAEYDDGSVRGQVLLSPVAMAAIEMMATKPSVN